MEDWIMLEDIEKSINLQKWQMEQEYCFTKALELFRIPKELFGEDGKIIQQTNTENYGK